MCLTHNMFSYGRTTPVPVANQTLANGSLESGLVSHEIKINRPRTIRDPFNNVAVSIVWPECERYWPNSMPLISGWQAEVIRISHFRKLGENLLADLYFFSSSLLNRACRHVGPLCAVYNTEWRICIKGNAIEVTRTRHSDMHVAGKSNAGPFIRGDSMERYPERCFHIIVPEQPNFDFNTSSISPLYETSYKKHDFPL